MNANKKNQKKLSFVLIVIVVLNFILLGILIKVSRDLYITYKQQNSNETKASSLSPTFPPDMFLATTTPTITVEPTATPYVPTARDKAISYFADVLSAVNSDTSGTFSNISTGTTAHSAIVSIEKLHKNNSDDPVIEQLYTCCEIISLVHLSEYSGWSSYFDQAKVLSETLVPNYSGPYAKDISDIVVKLFGNTSTSNKASSNSTSSNGYSSLTKTDKAKIIQYMEGRYTYYDSHPNGYSGSKTDQVWKDAMKKYSLSKAEVDLIWADFDAWQLYWSW